MSWDSINILLLSLLIIAVAASIALVLFRQTNYKANVALPGTAPSFSVATLRMLASKNKDMESYFKSFYDMKYENLVFVIKGVGGTIILFITPFIEKIATATAGFTNSDYQLLIITALLVILQVMLAFRLKMIVKEYGETIRIYCHYKQP